MPNQTVIVCQPPHDGFWEKLGPSLPALSISLLALGMSVCSFFYVRSKDSRARQQSIVDDYWLRKIVSPMTIEPFLKLATELALKLPTEAMTGDEIHAFWMDQVRRTRELSVAFMALALIDEQLSSEIEAMLLDFEDNIAQYCGNLRGYVESGTAKPDRELATSGILSISIDIFTRIKKHQNIVQ